MEGRVFVIGDIHGCLFTFRELIYSILRINRSDTIYLLGDYIDRGPGSKGVLDEIMRLIGEGYMIKPIKGNHEEMMLESLENPAEINLWIKNGAHTTLDSFDAEFPDEIENKYYGFISCLPYYYLLKDFVIVHGGLNFNIPNPLSDTASMPWERNKSVDKEKIGGRRLIVGHTPTRLEEVKASLRSDRILLDGGCVYYRKYEGLGHLCALELNSFELFSLLNIDYV